MNGEPGHTMARDPMPEDYGAEELIDIYVDLCDDLGLHIDQTKLAALELIDAAAARKERSRIHAFETPEYMN